MAFKEDSLGNPTVLDFGFGDVEGFIGEVIVDFNFPDAVVFFSPLYHVLLEVGIESENLAVVLDPRRLDPGDGVIFGRRPISLETQIVDTLSELVDEIQVDLFGHILFFFLTTVVGVAELLGFVEVLLVGVVEDMPWQEGHLTREVRLHFYSLFSYIFTTI